MATWTWALDPQDIGFGARAKTLFTDMDGKEKRSAKGTPRRTFSGKLQNFYDDIDEVVNFFIERHGETQAFDFYHPKTSEKIRVRFDMGDIDATTFYFVTASVGVKFLEVIE